MLFARENRKHLMFLGFKVITSLHGWIKDLQEQSSDECVRACMLSCFSCVWLFLCDSVDCSPPDSSVHAILQARTPQWAAMPSSRGASRPRDRTCVSCCSCIAGRFWLLSHRGNSIRWLCSNYLFQFNTLYIWRKEGYSDPMTKANK